MVSDLSVVEIDQKMKHSGLLSLALAAGASAVSINIPDEYYVEVCSLYDKLSLFVLFLFFNCSLFSSYKKNK